MARPLILPCCEKSLCLDPGTPILNLSAELDDGPSYIGASYNGQNPRRIGSNPGVNPPPPGFCISNVSQLVADQCAERDQVSHDNPGGPQPEPVARFGNVAQSCTFTCPDGLPFTYVVAAGTYLGFNQTLVDRAAFSFACNLAQQNRICLSSLLDHGCVGDTYSDTIIPLGTGPFTFAIVSGALPPGLALSQTNTVATISGTPTVAGSFIFQIRVTSANGNFMQKTYVIDILTITNDSPLPAFTVGTPYSVQLNAVGGTAPYSFEITDGVLPDDLTLSATGLISGTPTSSADTEFTVGFEDAEGVLCDKRFQLKKATVTGGAYFKMDELGGSRVDSVGGNNLVEVNGAVGFAAGIISLAASFNGPPPGQPILQSSSNTFFVFPADWSVSFWYFPVPIGGDAGTRIIGNTDPTEAVSGQFVFSTNMSGGPFGIMAVYDAAMNPTAFFTGVNGAVWNHFVLTWEAGLGRIRVYLNGVLNAQVAGLPALNMANSKLFIGGPPSAQRVASGSVDEVGLWKRLLTAAEITALYNGGAGKAFGAPGFPPFT